MKRQFQNKGQFLPRKKRKKDIMHQNWSLNVSSEFSGWTEAVKGHQCLPFSSIWTFPWRAGHSRPGLEKVIGPPSITWHEDGKIYTEKKSEDYYNCSHEINRRLLLGRKVMTNLDSIFKSRDITLPTKVHLVKAMVLPVVTYGCESWTVKKAKRGRIDAFELWCWRRLLRVPWTARRSNQSHSNGDQPWVFFGRNNAKAETPVLWPPHVKSWLIGKDSATGREWGKEEKGMTEEMAG